MHLELWAQGVLSVPIIGPLFLFNAVAGVVFEVLLNWKYWLPVLAAIGFGAMTLLAFGLAVTVGLFGMREVAIGVPQLLVGVAEAVTVLAGIVLLSVGTR